MRVFSNRCTWHPNFFSAFVSPNSSVHMQPHYLLRGARGSAPSGMLVKLHPIYGLIKGLGLAIKSIQACLSVLCPVTQTDIGQLGEGPSSQDEYTIWPLSQGRFDFLNCRLEVKLVNQIKCRWSEALVAFPQESVDWHGWSLGIACTSR